MGSAAASVDGRKARSARTRAAIVEGCLDLIQAGDLRPTAASIAAKAELSVRSVFQHFRDLEDLFLAVAERQANRVAELFLAEPYEGSLEVRLDQFVTRRVRLHEAVSPMRRAAVLHEPFSETVRHHLELARLLNFHEVAMAFEPELGTVASPKHPELLEAIAVMAGWPAWETLRTERSLDQEGAEKVFLRGLTALLDAAVADSAATDRD